MPSRAINARVQDQPGIPGQNTPNPKSIFDNHKVVLIGNTLYDPSYGLTYSLGPANNPLVTFEAAAIAGYVGTWPVLNVQNYLVLQRPGPGATSTRLVMSTMT